MIVNEYRLVVPSGEVHSAAYELGNAEYIAGFYTCSDLDGNLHIEDGLTADGPFRTVYGPDDKQLKWNTLYSGAFHIITEGSYHKAVRFTLSQAKDTDCAVFLRTVEL